jgi:hypothetical protein
MLKILVPFLFSSISFASVLEPVKGTYSFKDAPEYQAILTHLKSFGEFSQKGEKPMSQGEKMVEEAKARNRAILAERNRLDKEPTPEKSSELDKWKALEKKTLNEWKKESRDQLKAWKREQEIFLGRLPVYKENTFRLPVKEEKIIEKQIPIEVIPDAHIVNEAFNVPIRDQAARPTCVAFAGIRAIETILTQHDSKLDLSEQYLYWAGKPKCQSSPCAEKGSWITPAYLYSQSRPSIDIPLETSCVYKGESRPKNETQLPLAASCKDGAVKVRAFEDVRTLSDVVQYLKRDIPVVVAAKLSENFYKNQGLVTLEESEKISGGKLDLHALGHAFLAVGLIELPEKLKAKEGNFCIVVANSWGKGWGAGGYSCLTQNWFEKYRQPSPFVAVTKVSVL